MALFLFIFTIPVPARDYKETEDIINRILKKSDQQVPVDKNSEVKDEENPDGETTEEPSEKTSPDKDRSQSKASGAPGADAVMLKTGIEFFNSGHLASSLKSFDDLLSKYPQSPYADSSRIWKGKIFIKQYQYDKAIQEFSTIKDDSGEYPAALFNTAECLMAKGQLEPALENYQKISLLFPEHELADNALLQTGRLFMSAKNGNQAMSALIRIIQEYRDRETIDDAYYFLAKLYEGDPVLRDVETARKLYKLFLVKCDRGEEHFKNSPLKERVQNDLKHLEKVYFKLEQ